MSKTKKDKFHREFERKYTDGGYKRSESTVEHRKEKRMKNVFRSNNLNDIMNSYSS